MIQGRNMTSLPDKLKVDAIVEALLEIQFDHNEMPEVIVGQLARSSVWAGYVSSRQPAGALPIALLEADPNLKFQPTIQLDRPEPGEVVRIGPHVLSLHVLKPYPGWGVLGARIDDMIASLYDALGAPVIHRAGLRYINALTPEHGFDSFWDMSLDVEVRSERPSDDLLAGYAVTAAEDTKIQIKVASPAFVNGPDNDAAVAFIDLDVQTRAPLGSVPAEILRSWVERAHALEKKEFFRLWPDEKIEAMRA